MRNLACLIILVGIYATASGQLIQTFQIDSPNGTIAADTLTLSLPGLVADGVSFTATLSVTGNGVNVDHNTFGLGVDGTTINAGESLTFSLSTSAALGGTVTFDGFTSLDFNSFTTNDSGVFSPDAVSPNGDDIDLGTSTLGEYALPSAPITGFSIFGTAAGSSTSFQLDDVTAQFTGTAIPEPSPFLLFSVVGISFAAIRCLRR